MARHGIAEDCGHRCNPWVGVVAPSPAHRAWSPGAARPPVVARETDISADEPVSPMFVLVEAGWPARRAKEAQERPDELVVT